MRVLVSAGFSNRRFDPAATWPCGTAAMSRFREWLHGTIHRRPDCPEGRVPVCNRDHLWATGWRVTQTSPLFTHSDYRDKSQLFQL
jgi:hypothetical protein